MAEAKTEIIELEKIAAAILELHQFIAEKSYNAVDLAAMIGVLKDTHSGHKLLAQIGIGGKYYIKELKGVQYIILKGNASLRSALKGTRYLADNPKVTAFGIGTNAIKSAAKVNAVIMIVAYTALDVAQYILSDKQTLSDLFGNLIVNVAIGAASIAAATIFASAAVGLATVAIPTAAVIGGAIVVGMLTSYTLNVIADKLELKQKLSNAISWTARGFQAGVVRAKEVISNAHYTVKTRMQKFNRSLNRYQHEFERNLILHLAPRAYNWIYRR